MDAHIYICMHKWLRLRALINDDDHWLGVELQENEACFLFYQHIITSPSLCSGKWHAVDAKESWLPSLTSNKASISTPQLFVLLKCTLHWRHRAVWWVSDILVSNYWSAVWPVQSCCEVNNPTPALFPDSFKIWDSNIHKQRMARATSSFFFCLFQS